MKAKKRKYWQTVYELFIEDYLHAEEMNTKQWSDLKMISYIRTTYAAHILNRRYVINKRIKSDFSEVPHEKVEVIPKRIRNTPPMKVITVEVKHLVFKEEEKWDRSGEYSNRTPYRIA